MTVLQPITYKQVTDTEGNFAVLELWQGDQHITIDFTDGKSFAGYRWDEVSATVRRIIMGVQATAGTAMHPDVLTALTGSKDDTAQNANT